MVLWSHVGERVIEPIEETQALSSLSEDQNNEHKENEDPGTEWTDTGLDNGYF